MWQTGFATSVVGEVVLARGCVSSTAGPIAVESNRDSGDEAMAMSLAFSSVSPVAIVVETPDSSTELGNGLVDASGCSVRAVTATDGGVEVSAISLLAMLDMTGSCPNF